jgi:hypothetical protein
MAYNIWRNNSGIDKTMEENVLKEKTLEASIT